jgi:predicted DNA-binding protein (MmcQ/YjbR family)
LTQDLITEYILSFPQVSLDKSYGDDILVYKVGQDEGEMFALITDNKNPVRLSLRCDPKLASHLREKYDEVMAGVRLDTKKWNTIVMTGQLSPDEIKALIRHSYDLSLHD